MNRVRVIGSGNAFNFDGRAHACYLIEDSLLLDCGASSPASLRSLGVDLTKLQGVLLTHFHGDHAAGLPFLYLNMHFIEGRTEPLHLMGPAGTRDIARQLLDVMYPGLDLAFPVLVHEIEPGTAHTFSRFTIQSMPITHKEESLGYRITWNNRTFAFSGDSAYDEKLFRLVEGVDLALVELSMFENPSGTAHVSLSEIGEELKARRVVFTHIYDELAAAAESRGLETAHDGLRLEF